MIEYVADDPRLTAEAFVGLAQRIWPRACDATQVALVQEADERTTGPASFIAVDPDGNPTLVDQHV